MKKIFFYNLLILITSLNISNIISDGLDKSFRQELRNNAEALFGIGNTDVDLRKFSKDTKILRKWNTLLDLISRQIEDNQILKCIFKQSPTGDCKISNQAIINIKNLSDSIIDKLNTLKNGLKNPVPTNPKDIDDFLNDILTKIETLKDQIKSKNFTDSKIDKDTKELINVFVKIFEDIVKKAKDNLIPKIDALKKDMDYLFGQLDIRNIEKLKSKIDLELENLNLFVKYSESKDLPPKFQEYKNSLNKITNSMIEFNKTYINESNKKEDQKPDFSNFSSLLKTKITEIEDELKKATKAPDIFVFNAGPKQSKELMLYLAGKYKELTKNFKDQWENELKEKIKVGSPVQNIAETDKAILEAINTYLDPDSIREFNYLLRTNGQKNIGLDAVIKFIFEKINSINFIVNNKFDEKQFYNIQNIEKSVFENIKKNFDLVFESNDYNNKLFEDFSKLSRILVEIKDFYTTNNDEPGLKKAIKNIDSYIKSVKSAMNAKAVVLNNTQNKKVITKAMNNLIGEYEKLNKTFIEKANIFLSNKKP